MGIEYWRQQRKWYYWLLILFAPTAAKTWVIFSVDHILSKITATFLIICSSQGWIKNDTSNNLILKSKRKKHTFDYWKAVMLDWHWKDAVKNSASHEIENRNLLALWNRNLLPLWKAKHFLLNIYKKHLVNFFLAPSKLFKEYFSKVYLSKVYFWSVPSLHIKYFYAKGHL